MELKDIKKGIRHKGTVSRVDKIWKLTLLIARNI